MIEFVTPHTSKQFVVRSGLLPGIPAEILPKKFNIPKIPSETYSRIS